MVVRTKTAQAITQGNLLQYEREGIELVVIDGRQSNNPCTEFLGKVYSIKGNHPDYPPLGSLPGISKGAGPRQRVSANDEPKYLAAQIKAMVSPAARLKMRTSSSPSSSPAEWWANGTISKQWTFFTGSADNDRIS